MLVDREALYRTFYGERPPPPPWATDCPIRFDVWLAFAEAVRTVSVGDAATALGLTQAALRKRLPSDFPGARRAGATWRVPILEVRGEGGALAADVATSSNVEDHPRVDVILAVNDDFGPAWLLDRLRGVGGLRPVSGFANPIAAGGYVAVLLTFAELVQSVIPLTNLGRKIRTAQTLGPLGLRRALDGVPFDLPPQSEATASPSATPEQVAWEARQQVLRHNERAAHLRWFLHLLAAVVGPDPAALDSLTTLLMQTSSTEPTELPEMVSTKVIDRRRRYPIQSVNLNRQARPAVSRSRITIKADAAEQLFGIDTSTLTWAVVDSGIDAMHTAFSQRDDNHVPVIGPGGVARSRVSRTFDLVGARRVLAADAPINGLIDWNLAIPFVEMLPPGPPVPPFDPVRKPWMAPSSTHGTHVAGILAADWPENGLRGICPGLRLYDVRVLDGEGHGDEFSIVAALQLIRHINEQAGRLVIAGVNLSLSVPHDVANHSTGWTPVCVECDRLMRSGVVVVAAAGNAGFEGGSTTVGFGFNTVSISDPGNTESVITVGSTHRSDPHRHGVSYFSSRGPTADGRRKPDLLAPGEDIDGPVPGGGLQAMHGTSQAAAHVSGAAALLMARHRELIGRPEMVKEILCRTATDLGRDQAFQGHGLVDALRAIQSV